jgi:hypothetical protein
MWGPILGWCALEMLAESIDAENPERVALDLFDRLRLREPFAQAFATLGFEGEEGWRVAARIKVVLLTGAGVGKLEEVPSVAEPQSPVAGASDEPTAARDEKIALSPGLWLDPDVLWLTGVHEAGGHSYLVRELYEELLWWLLMPSLLRLAGQAAPSRAAVEEMRKTVEEALETAEAAGYRIDALLGVDETPDSVEEVAGETESQGLEPEQPEDLERQKTEAESSSSAPEPVDPA